MKIDGGRLLSVVAIAPVLATGTDNAQLQTFQSWAHSPTTAVLMAIAWVALVAMAFTPLGRRITRRTASDTLRAVVVVLGVLGVISWLTRSPLLMALMMVLLWACVVWYVVTLNGPVVSRVGRLRSELDPAERARLQAEQTAAAERGAVLERVLDEADEDRHSSDVRYVRGAILAAASFCIAGMACQQAEPEPGTATEYGSVFLSVTWNPWPAMT